MNITGVDEKSVKSKFQGLSLRVTDHIAGIRSEITVCCLSWYGMQYRVYTLLYPRTRHSFLYRLASTPPSPRPIKQCEALALSPGMWIRLRRLTITKNKLTGFMSAKLEGYNSSINPLHSRMAEVQAIAAKYVERCTAHASGRAPRLAPAHPSPAVPASPPSGAAAAQPPPANKGSNANNNSSDISNRSHSNQSSSGTNTTAPQHQHEQSRSYREGDTPPDTAGYGRRLNDAVSGQSTSAGQRGGAEGEGGRGTKRPLPAGVTRQSAGPTGSAVVGAGARGAWGGRQRFSNLLAAMAAPAPHTCDVRVRVVSHSPPKVILWDERNVCVGM